MRAWCRVLAIAAGVAVIGLAPCPAQARDLKSEVSELDKMVQIEPKYPVPAEPNQVFYIQRSMNSNTVVYAANLDAAGKLDAKEPVKAYWRRYMRGGYVRPLGLAERILAYGVRSVKQDGPDGAYSFTLAALPERRLYVGLDDKGRPEAFGKVNGRWIKLVYVHIDVDDGGFLPGVSSMDFFGYDKKTGKPLREHLTRQ